MRLRIAILAVALGLTIPSVAQATLPTTAQLVWAHGVALAYWHSEPPCGVPVTTVAPLVERSGQAEPATCQITLNAAEEWESQASVCAAYVHEFGHLLLGLTYFAAVNPADPMHSPDPANIMYGGQRTSVPEWEAVERSVGCAATAHHKHRHHRRHHKR
jgi:hypothetical protein